MNQSTITFGFLLVAFIVFITQRGELPIYIGFLLASPKTGSGASGTTSAMTVNGVTSLIAN